MSLNDRIKLLEESFKKNKKIVVCITHDDSPAQFRYRCKNIMDATLDSKKWQSVWFLNSEIINVFKRINKIELVVIVRQAAKDRKVLDFINDVKERNKKVLFDLDDLIFDYMGLASLMNAIGSLDLPGWMGYVWGVRRIAKKVDGFICTNDYLADKIKRCFSKPVQVIPNSLNREQVEISDKLVKKKIINQDGFMVGYFSGSPTHVKDFRMVEPELIRFLSLHENTKLKVVGDMKFSDEMEKWIDIGRVEISKKVDYLKLQELMSGVDVNIAPLLINDFTNCKSELKFFEAAAVETTTIASPTYAFKNVIEDGENGFLAGPGDWLDIFEYLFNNLKKNREVAKRARKYALKHYYGNEFRKQVEEVYDYFAK